MKLATFYTKTKGRARHFETASWNTDWNYIKKTVHTEDTIPSTIIVADNDSLGKCFGYVALLPFYLNPSFRAHLSEKWSLKHPHTK